MGLSRQVRRANERALAKGRGIYRAPKVTPIEMTEEEAEALLTSHSGRYPKHGVDNKLSLAKGQVFGGECNRTACDSRGATWWNRGTFGFYCKRDAMAINEGHAEPLCIPLKEKPDFETMEALRRMRIAS